MNISLSMEAQVGYNKDSKRNMLISYWTWQMEVLASLAWIINHLKPSC